MSPAPYRELNKNGKMDVYEDKSQPVEKRIEDLIKQMTIEEKAGMMFIAGTLINQDGTIEKKNRCRRFCRTASFVNRIDDRKKDESF